jgi:hypothetical protein
MAPFTVTTYGFRMRTYAPSALLFAACVSCGSGPVVPHESVLPEPQTSPDAGREPLPRSGAEPCLPATAPELAGSHVSRADLDGDGAPDWLVEDGRSLELYVQRASCAEHVDSLDPEGNVAFVHVAEQGPKGELRGLTVDTWLMHGDRARRRYRWTKSGYVFVTREPDIIEGRAP